MKFGASASSARGTIVSGSFAAWSAASWLTYPAVAIACSTTLRRSRQRAVLLNGDSADGDWMTPAIVAASARTDY